MPREIDRKLRLTATFLGAIARKDLVAAFRRVNSHTSFEIGRADKWLQGRARPREQQVYDDWSKVLGLDRPGQWIADCDFEDLVDAVCERHGRDRAALLRDLDVPASRTGPSGSSLELAGAFVCYSHAWSPYFRGRVIRAELSVKAESNGHRLPVAYTEILPTGPMELKGALSLGKHGMHIQVSNESAGAQTLSFYLFPPSPPASIFAGLMSGTTVIGPDAQPSTTRIVVVRLPMATERLRSAQAYLPPQGSMAEDLASLGVQLDDPAAADCRLKAFLEGGIGGFDQIPAPDYRSLVDLFDRNWLSARRL